MGSLPLATSFYLKLQNVPGDSTNRFTETSFLQRHIMHKTSNHALMASFNQRSGTVYTPNAVGLVDCTKLKLK